MKIVAIIQARMTSTRLPGKVLKEVMNKTLLEYQLERVSRSKYIDEIVVATTINQTDEPIVELCKKFGVSVYRGSEYDVLSRYYEAAIQSNAEVIVRITSDCPLIDPEIVDQVIKLYIDNQVDYASNTLERTYPIGMDTEVFSFEALKQANEQATLERDREHVTAYMYVEQQIFQKKGLTYNKDLSNHRWTVDTNEDFELVSKLLEHLYSEKPQFTMGDIIELIDRNILWSEINMHIEQKKM